MTHCQRVLFAIALLALALPAVATAQQEPPPPVLTMVEGDFCVTELPPGVGPKGSECSPGGIWGDFVYFADSNGDLICRVDFLDNANTFASGAPDLDFPVGMAFGPGPAADFGDFLYVASYQSNQITRVDQFGNTSLFAAYTGPSDLVFDPTGAYGTELFATTAYAGPITKVDNTGTAVAWSSVPATYMRFGPGGAWGFGLYAAAQGAPGAGSIESIDASGVGTTFATGFTTPEGFDWAFGPGWNGDMFAPDYSEGKIWRIQSDGTMTLWAEVERPSSITWCNGMLYVTSHAGGCWKIEACPPVKTERRSFGGLKGGN